MPIFGWPLAPSAASLPEEGLDGAQDAERPIHKAPVRMGTNFFPIHCPLLFSTNREGLSQPIMKVVAFYFRSKVQQPKSVCLELLVSAAANIV